MAKPKILFVLPWLPYPMTSGGHQAIFNGIKAICDYADIFITYIDHGKTTANDIDSFRKAIDKCQICPYIKPQSIVSPAKEHWYTRCISKYKSLRHSIKILLKRIVSGGESHPQNANINTQEYKNWLNVLFPFDECFALFVRDIVVKERIDIVQCEMIRNANIVLFLPQTVKTVFVHHELRTVRYSLEMPAIKGDITTKKAYLDFFEICEVGILNKFDAVITLSKTDKEKLEGEGVTSRIYPSTAIVSTEIVEIPISKRYNVLTFIGSDSHSPNSVGILWFLENCWNTILEEDNSYQLKIIGMWSEDFKKPIISRYQNITFTGFVEDLKSEIQDTIMIVPITIGSGIRMKILEAASIGVPIVSTTIGAEGLPMVDGQTCLIADNPSSFISAIRKYQETDLRNSVIQSAQNMIRKYYCFDTFATNRKSVYNDILYGQSS